jgi:muramoyltetrapeptide carboxypeptidase
MRMEKPRKPRPLKAGGRVRVVAPASPMERGRFDAGCRELARLGYSVGHTERVFAVSGFFAGTKDERATDLADSLNDAQAGAVIYARGGYGTDQLLPLPPGIDAGRVKLLVGYSDATSLQIYLWQKYGWVTIYGPMVATGLDHGEGKPGGYDGESLRRAVAEVDGGWTIPLEGSELVGGEGEGAILGGCMTMLEDTIGTPWEIDTRGAILLLEDCLMKPYQVDRALMHLRHSGKFEAVRGIVFGEFPACEPPEGSRVTVEEVTARHTRGLGVPVVWGAAIGHSRRAMRTVPLGVRGRLRADGAGVLEILEPACAESEEDQAGKAE